MQVKVQHSGGMESNYEVERLPFVDEPFGGELVREVLAWVPPRGGCHGFVILRDKSADTPADT